MEVVQRLAPFANGAQYLMAASLRDTLREHAFCGGGLPERKMHCASARMAVPYWVQKARRICQKIDYVPGAFVPLAMPEVIVTLAQCLMQLPAETLMCRLFIFQLLS